MEFGAIITKNDTSRTAEYLATLVYRRMFLLPISFFANFNHPGYIVCNCYRPCARKFKPEQQQITDAARVSVKLRPVISRKFFAPNVSCPSRRGNESNKRRRTPKVYIVSLILYVQQTLITSLPSLFYAEEIINRVITIYEKIKHG